MDGKRMVRLGAAVAMTMAAVAIGAPIDGAGLWLKADAITGVADGGTLATWADASGNGRDFAQTDAAKRPLYYSGGVHTLNGLPVLRFDGANDFLAGNAAALSTLNDVSGGTVFAVRKLDATGSSRIAFVQSITGAISGRLFIAQGDDNHRYTVGARNGDASTGVFTFGGTATDTQPTIQVGLARYTQTTAGAVKSYANGTLASENTGSLVFPTSQNTPNTNSAYAAIGALADGSGSFFNGNIAEIIVYPRALNDAERLLVDNYLSAKYAITLAAGADHYAGDTAGNGDYDRDVFGIGRVDASNQVLTGAWNGLAITADSLDNGEWLLAGHQTPVNALTGADLPAGDLDWRWERVWYLDATGSVDATLSFDFGDAGLAMPGVLRYSLLYSPTNAFAFAELALTPTVAGDQVSFAMPAAMLLDGYYTLAFAIPEPASLALLGLALLGLGRRQRRRA